MVTRTLQYKCLRPRLKRLLGVIFKSLSVSESCCLYPQHKGDVTQDFRGHPWSHNLQSWYPESQATLLPGPALPSSQNPSCPTPSSGNLHCPTPAMKHFALSILSSICRMLATCQPSLVFYMRTLFWSSQPLYEGKDGFPQILQVCWSPPALPSAEAAVSPLLTSTHRADSSSAILPQGKPLLTPLINRSAHLRSPCAFLRLFITVVDF